MAQHGLSTNNDSILDSGERPGVMDGEGKEDTNELFPAVYGILKELARRMMQQEAAGHTLQPTALVHEAYLRLSKDAHTGWENRRHFYGAAARAMRRILDLPDDLLCSPLGEWP